MKIDPSFDPLSLSSKARKRAEGLAKGTIANSESTTSTASSSNFVDSVDSLTSSPVDSLKETFMSMLLGQPSANSSAHQNSEDRWINSAKDSRFSGTADLFSPLKECEEKKLTQQMKSEEFSFSIESEKLGPLNLKGSFDGQVLKVVLQLQGQYSVQQLSVLKNILQPQLAVALNTKVELQIDRSPSSNQRSG